ncbi:MAG: hypothetical protein H8Z69_03055 [Nanohaloarchaea archaeon]|nr:hypothetical protein [Candidatus Nanohaloarchaea archaeon]
MDKTIELVLVAMVTLITALVIVYMVQGEASGFGDFLDGQESTAECDLAKEKVNNCLVDEVPDVESCSPGPIPQRCKEDGAFGSSGQDSTGSGTGGSDGSESSGGG